jgi:hypothetical protein
LSAVLDYAVGDIDLRPWLGKHLAGLPFDAAQPLPNEHPS